MRLNGRRRRASAASQAGRRGDAPEREAEVGLATDTTYSGGSPSMGFYNQGGTIGDNADYGFSSYTASSP
jgi:hypothetical protein